MKRFICVILAVCASGLIWADSSAKEEVSLLSLMRNAYPEAKAKTVSSQQIVYEVSKDGMMECILALRAAKGQKFRVDFITKTDFYSYACDGDHFWGYEKGKGIYALSSQDIDEMKIDMAFLPLPFFRSNTLEPLQKNGTALQRSIKCTTYRTVPIGQADAKITIWVSDKTKLIRMTKMDSPEGHYATSYHHYRNFDGIRLASGMQLTGPDEVLTVRLVSAEWNNAFPENLFRNLVPEKDPAVISLRQLLLNSRNDAARKLEEKREREEQKAAAEERKKEEAKIARSKQYRLNLEKKVRALPILIEAKKKRMDQLEKVIMEDRSRAYSAASSDNGGYRSSFVYNGWGHRHSHGHGGFHRRSLGRLRLRPQRALAGNLAREAQEAFKEYDKLSEELTNMRIELSDAQAELANLKK